MTNLKILFDKSRHIECDLILAKFDESTSRLTIITDHKGIEHALDYYFNNLIIGRSILTEVCATLCLTLDLRILPAFATKYKGKNMSNIVLCTDGWMKEDGKLWNLFSETEDVDLEEPISPYFELIDQPVCGGCPLDTCKNCPIFK